MKKHISIQKLSIAGLTVFGMSAGLVAGISPAAGADAAELVTFTATIHPVDAADGTFTLTFQGQTTSPGKGGRVEYEWKVEAGEKSEEPLGLTGLDAADGAKGGNVEFEWKVEEGES